MKSLITAVVLLLVCVSSAAQDLYVRTFGSLKSKPLIFLHGGPGYNSASFEATTAQRIADSGFFVIVYDRRGEGRSPDRTAKYTFEEAVADLLAIQKKYGVEKSILVGHSFGGILATKFASMHPGMVSAIVLVGAPVSLQATFRNIIQKSREFYRTRNDSTNLNYISLIEAMDTSSLMYSSYCLAHAMQNGFYSPKRPSDEAKQLYLKFTTDTILKEHASKMDNHAPTGFWRNEKYTTIDLSVELKALLDKNIQVFALYGKEDGLYSVEQIERLQQLVSPGHLRYLDNCSHNVFIDQQSQFIQAIKLWTK